MTAGETLLRTVDLALRDDSGSHIELVRAAILAQSRWEGRVQDSDPLRWFGENWITNATSSLGPGFSLGFISLQRLQQILHDPFIRLAKKEGITAGVPREIIDFRRSLFSNWMNALKDVLFGWGSDDTGIPACFAMKVDKRSEVAMSFARGNFPQEQLLL